MANNVYTVKQINSYIKNMFTQDFMLSRIYVKGEVSNCKYHSSGHIYFSLKDESGTMACVMFAGSRSGLAFRMEEGQQVVVFGRISVYERQGTYQLYAQEIRLDGEGVLYERYQQLKKELQEMGMFAPEYKQPLPFYPQTVGIVTAGTGAAIRDIINISGRRNPYIQLILYPAKVQGEGAAQSIVNGIHALEEYGVDVMIIGRGGGSIEDLWAFNEEIVARAVFDCQIPVVSAVGHESDTAISDFVADLRAPTPSAAAELVIPDLTAVSGTIEEYRRKLNVSITGKVKQERLRLDAMKTKVRLMHPQVRLLAQQQYAAELQLRLERLMKFKLERDRNRLALLQDQPGRLMQAKLERDRHRLGIFIQAMKGLSPLAKLESGFSYVAGSGGRAIKSIQGLKKDDPISVYMRDGRVDARVTGIQEELYGEEK